MTDTNDTSRFSRLEADVQRVMTLSNQIAQTLAVHQLKYEDVNKFGSKLDKYIDQAPERDHHNATRFAQIMDERENRLSQSLAHLRELLLSEIENKNQTTRSLIGSIDKKINEMASEHTEITVRVDQLERWQWMILGGAAVISFLIQNVLSII